MNIRELRAKRANVLDQAKALVTRAEGMDRDLTEDEQGQYNDLVSQADQLEARAKRLETLPADLPESVRSGGAPTFVRQTGDNEARAFAAYFRSGDTGGVSHLRTQAEDGEGRGPAIELKLPMSAYRKQARSRQELRAVDSTMNITTAADGGATVPTGLAPMIAARVVETRLAERLGCQMIPGVGTTVNHTYENADPVVFATTSEQADNGTTNAFERDAMVLANKAFTLVKKTKKVHLTEELLEDTGENLTEAIASWVARGMAMTHNSMLMTEAAASGTAAKTFASATAIADGEPEDIMYNATVAYYMEDGGSVGWVARPPTIGAIKKLSASPRSYVAAPNGPNGELLGYPYFFSNYAAAVAASAKSLYFGNWFFMGYRESDTVKLIRDPYSIDGIVALKYSFRAVYGLLIAGAIGYGTHPTA
jgi:HK97 family phage major capsid protein